MSELGPISKTLLEVDQRRQTVTVGGTAMNVISEARRILQESIEIVDELLTNLKDLGETPEERELRVAVTKYRERLALLKKEAA